MVRTPSFDKNGIKKGAWSPEEDKKLKDYILQFGHWNWRELPKHAGLKRCGKSCRLRWMNYLRPDVKHGKYTKEEEDLILQLHQQHGNKWATIASNLAGRTDNEIKNHWHTHLKKRVEFQKPAKIVKAHKPLHDQIDAAQKNNPTSSMHLCGDDIQILESCPLSSSEMGPTSSTYTTSCDISSSNFEISNSSTDFDDGGLEEMLNSSDPFADMWSLLCPSNHAHAYDHDPNLASYDREFGIQLENPVITMDDIYEELEKDDLWSKPLSDDYNEVLLSPCVNFYDDSVFHLFEETMQEMP